MPNADQRQRERNKAYWKKNRIPVNGYFELTPRCTFDCKMCYVHLTPEQMGERRELSTEEWLQIVDEAIENNLLTAVLTGGECMLHPGFWQIYEHMRNSGVTVMVNTNAFALTEADIARFQELPPSHIRVTIYGGSEEGYLRCTGRPAFARVVENLRRLRDADLNVMLCMTLSRYNVEEMESIFRVTDELGMRPSYNIDLFQANPDTGRIMEDYQLPPEELLKTEIKLLACRGFRFYQNEALRELPQRMPEDSSHGMVCGAGRNSYCVNWDGSMSLCVGFPGVVSLLEMPFAEAWKRLVQVSDDYVTPVECNTCKLRPVCTPCPIARCDPQDPGHCNLQRCELTVKRYNAGVLTLDPNTPRQEVIPETQDGLC